MQSLNILAVGNKIKTIDLIQHSKYINKIYTTSQENIKGVFNIKFNTFKELADKCKALQIDIVIVEDERWILEGIADVLKKSFVNCIAPTAYWTKLALSNRFAREMMKKYSINTPKEILLPFKFPTVVKGDGITKLANSLNEIIKIKQEIFNFSPEIAKTVYLEEYIDAKKYTVTSLFDGKNLLTFPQKEVDSKLLKDYSTNLQRMLNTEKAKFIGFINSEIMIFDNKIYNTGFSFDLLKPDTASDIELNYDFLYLLNSAIYQKLDEIRL